MTEASLVPARIRHATEWAEEVRSAPLVEWRLSTKSIMGPAYFMHHAPLRIDRIVPEPHIELPVGFEVFVDAERVLKVAVSSLVREPTLWRPIYVLEKKLVLLVSSSPCVYHLIGVTTSLRTEP